MTKIPPTEKDIEASILAFLENLGGFAMKINLGGRPIQTKDGRLLMMPFKNPFSAKGMSDILFIYEGCVFCFEVKKPSEVKFIKNSYQRLQEGSFSAENKTYRRLRDQIIFIERVKSNGGYGGFVSSIEEVKSIIHLANL